MFNVPDESEVFVTFNPSPLPTVIDETWATQYEKPLLFKCELDITPVMEGENGMEAFLKRFPKDPAFHSSGRGSEQIKGNFQALQPEVEALTSLGSRLAMKLSKPEVDWVKTPWLYIYRSNMMSCGPEYGFIDSIKVTTTGARRARLVQFNEFLECIASTRRDGNVGLKEAKDSFANVRSLNPCDNETCCNHVKSCGDSLGGRQFVLCI